MVSTETGKLALLLLRGSGSRLSVSCYGHYRVSLLCYSSGVVAVDLQSLVMVTTGDRLAWSVTPQG